LGLLDFEELEACEALNQRDKVTIVKLLSAWQDSEYRQASFRSYVWSRYGGQNLGRPEKMQRALAEANEVILQRLEPNGTGEGPGHDATTSTT